MGREPTGFKTTFSGIQLAEVGLSENSVYSQL